MPHKSRLVGIVIDCQNADLDAATTFWSGALGRAEKGREGKYVMLKTHRGEPMMLLQSVDHPSRVHLDIESTDVDAEVARLEKLGAKKVQKVQTWWVMEAPTGQRFCVVRQQGKDLDGANEWP